MSLRRILQIRPRLPHAVRLLAGLIGLGLAVSPLSAQVGYVRDLSGTENMDLLLPQTGAPIDTSDPLYDPDLPDTQWIFTEFALYPFQPQAGQLSTRFDLPDELKVSRLLSISTRVGVGTSDPVLRVVGRVRTIFTVSLARVPIVMSSFQVPLAIFHSIAAPDRTNLTVIGGDTHIAGLYSINSETGDAVQVITFTSGTAPGEFSLETYYHAYAPNGRVYLLDYGNNRMQMLDPANAFSYVSEFALETSVTTANMQFAIGPTGNLYLGDGLGGGSYYSAEGDFLGTFSLDTPVDPALDIGAPYLSADSSGGVYVFDNTGFHQYINVSTVPEPSTYFLAISGLLMASILRRRRAL